MQRTTTSRARLLAAAEQVFYEQGITKTNIDAVARTAGVTKPTVYAHFASKSALAAGALEARQQRVAADLAAHLAGEDPGAPRLTALFTWLASWYEHSSHRGCAFLNAAAESAADDVVAAAVRAEKEWLFEVLHGLCEEAECDSPGELASQLLLLIDGVAARVLVHGPGRATEATAAAAHAAAVLLATASQSHDQS
ncbi:TetR/AcrR family transcriptional regulator [Streptomyces sp. NRRL S-813]|uniref:TetR/AcrR family transcriptional regulator n=1 Tax=Streptomyces sp. NRRL S-813 TaxID=1463919 RepID=UPI000564DE8A|nr:TetR/AcrR family transcriptional regulator [Streptomyces sp. NRRL S-813]